MIFGALFGLALAAEPVAPPAEPVEPSPRTWSPTILFGAKTRPVGVGITASLMTSMLDTKSLDVNAGPYVALYYYWYEANIQARVTVLGGLGVLTMQAGLEPGWYLPVATMDSGERGWDVREFGLRGIARTTLELNVRTDHFWIYSRTFGVARGHTFEEYDPYRDLTLDGTELSGEQAVALMVAPFGAWHRTPDGKRPYSAYAWFYVEGIYDILMAGSPTRGPTDRSLHAGVIFEQVIPKLFIDLDGYWSFGPSDVLAGPGVLVVLTYSGG